MNKQDIIEKLSLVKHTEGGYFQETYRSQMSINTDRNGGDSWFVRRNSCSRF
ncbi:cupin domain-containing protein [Okeania sp.]|uniref:cupin domain-containing protein n=1 Tax=Okeania sp. TaxID=3100323 RepID=UPI0035C8975B